MSLAIRSARNFSVQIAGFLVALLDRILLTGLLIRAWGIATFSDWSILLAATALLATADLGFQTYLGNMLSRANARGRIRAFNRIVGLGLSFYALIAVLLLGGVAALAYLTDLRALLSLHRSDLLPVFLLFSAQQTLRTVRNAVAQVYRGMGDVHHLLWMDVRATGIGIVLAAAAVSGGAQPLEIALIYVSSEILFGTLWAAVHVRRRYRSVQLQLRRPSPGKIWSTARSLQWYSLFQMLSYLMSNLPVLIIGWLGFSGPLLVAFVVQRTLVNVGRTTTSTLSLAIGVELAADAEKQGGVASITGVLTLARINGALAGLMAAGLLLFGAELVSTWTGRSELGSLVILAWLLLPAAAVAPAVPLQQLSIFGHRLRPQATAAAAQAAITIPGAIIAGAHFGIVGVAAALALGEVLGMAVIAPLLTAGPLGVRYLPLVLSTALIWLLAFAWSGLVGLGIEAALPASGRLTLAAKLILWSGLGGVPVAWVSLTRDIRRRAVGLASSWIGGMKPTQ